MTFMLLGHSRHNLPIKESLMLSKKKHSKRPKRKKDVALEPLFIALKEALIHDLRVNVCFGGDVRSREPVHPSFSGAAPYLFKRFKQVLDFDKRIIWSSDKSFSILKEEALKAFSESQESFLLPEPLSERGFRVIQKAAEICSEILGPFSYADWFRSCSFGKRAAVGLPYRLSYLDNRFDKLSGTQKQWVAFNNCLASDMHLFRAMRERSKKRIILDEINATAVPKSFKAARIIAPDTILGGFLSRGLGDLIRARLEKETHINLSLQQERHRRWARGGSKTGHLATIDMSKASDSFTWRHIQYLVPSDWHEALDCVRVSRCNIGGVTKNLSSYMLMGSGHTFPLQTLLFYCLAEAVRQLSKSTGKASVYGDDIIVSTRIVKPLIVVFKELGFVINSEKSFYDSPDPLHPSRYFFRESCGGDYKGGIDVRPYMPECDLQEKVMVPRNTYKAWCHKLINGLLDHWEPEEIPFSLGILLNAVEDVCFVPAYETDHAGIRHYVPPQFLIGRACYHVTYKHHHPTYWRLVYTERRRKRGLRERPYLWMAYLLQHNNAADSCDPLCLGPDWLPVRNVQTREQYSPPIELCGETLKGVEGVFRWKLQGPKRLS